MGYYRTDYHLLIWWSCLTSIFLVAVRSGLLLSFAHKRPGYELGMAMVHMAAECQFTNNFFVNELAIPLQKTIRPCQQCGTLINYEG